MPQVPPTTMPPKRPPPTNSDDHSPPPAQRQAITPEQRPPPTTSDYHSPPPALRPAITLEHHLSPMAGHHPEIPADAAVATSTPPRTLSTTMAMQPPFGIPSENISPNVVVQIAPAQQEPPATEPAQIAATNGGARAAYANAQQQRIVSCNLTTLPSST